MVIVALIALLIVGGLVWDNEFKAKAPPTVATLGPNQTLASNALGELAVKPAASHAGYNREQFGSGWATFGNCDMREQILNLDLTMATDKSATDCTVLSGTLQDPYTGKTIAFKRGPGTSSFVQIDHIVAVSDAWDTGAQNLSAARREQFYNDPLELLAVSGPANDAKSSSDAADWLPPNKPYECRYVARQIAIKLKYHLWVTLAERTAMQKILNSCTNQIFPEIK